MATLIFIQIFKWFAFEADWIVVIRNLRLFVFGLFPEREIWRPGLWLSLLLVLSFGTLFKSQRFSKSKFIPYFWFISIPIGIYLLSGGFGLSVVSSNDWGGLTLTIFLTLLSSLFSFPLGVFLAVGRQSQLNAVRIVCKIYIDSMRAVPLIAILFFGQLLIPLFLPEGFEINRVTRAIIAFSLFVSAYVAEDIRGGMQSIPNSQIEAAKALGLGERQIIRLIMLPQAIAVAIPALTNQIVGLLQNTSLMSILGLVELLGISRSVLANPQYIGRYIEVYVWIAIVYWSICTIMSLLSRHIENSINYKKSIC